MEDGPWPREAAAPWTRYKAKFFDETEGHWIFNFDTFIDYISNKSLLTDSYTRFHNKIGLNIENKVLPELLYKNQLYVNLSEIEDEDFGVSKEDKALNKKFYRES